MSTATPITVLALNPSLDVSYEIPQLIADQKVRATTTHYHPGGNGLNVSRALVALGSQVHCCSILGGVSGDVVLQLLGEDLAKSHTWFGVKGNTRINAILLQQSPPGQYEVDSLGAEVPPELLTEISDDFLRRCGQGIGVLTGSLPAGVPPETYQVLAERLAAQGGKAAVDAYGPVLEHVLEARPHLLRINRYVLEQKVKRRLDSIEAVAETARELQRRGCELVCISMAGEGAVLVDADKTYYCPVPRVHVHSTVASGDVLMAGLVAGDANGDNHRKMLHRAVASATATAAHPGTEMFAQEELERLFDETEVQTLDI
jgi:6-phosphofructokinase 2